MNLIQRVQDILLKPKDTWPVIEREPGDVASIYTSYVIFLAAIPAVAAFIGLSIIGVGGFGLGYRLPILSGLFQMVLSYVLSLAAVFVLGLIVDALAPSFGGTKNQLNAIKLVAYGMTASFVAGIFSLLPMLGALGGLLGAIYSIYLIYTGIPVLMKCPPDKAVAYTAVVIVIGIVVMVVLGFITSLVMPARHLGGFGSSSSGGDVTFKTPGGEVSINTSKMEEAAKRMEAASKKVEQAQATGDQAAVGKAVGEMMGALGGATGGKAPIAAQDLKALLPETLGDMKRESFEASGGQAMGIAGSSAKARYVAGDKSVQLSITDLGGMGGMAALAGWANMTVDKETTDGIEKVYKDGSRTIREQYRKDGTQGEVTLILENGVLVEANGHGVNIGTLKGVVAGVDLGKIEALKRAAK